MKSLLQRLKKNAPTIITLPAILCAFTFVTNFIQAIQDGNIDAQEYHTLLSYVDGLEAVLLFIVALALKEKK